MNYVLYIEDAQKAQNFHTNYHSKQDTLKSEMGKMLTWLVSNSGGYYSEKKLYGYALAGILKGKDSGIVLLQSKGNAASFKQLDATVEMNADSTIHKIEYTIC